MGSRKNRRGVFFACAAALVGLSAANALAASARNPYPPVKDNGTVGDAAGTDTAAYLNDKPSDRTGRGSPASGTSTPIPPPDVPGTPPGPQNGPMDGSNTNGTGTSNGTGNTNGTGAGGAGGTGGATPGAGGTGGPGVGSGSGGSGGTGSGSGSGGGL